MLWKTGLTVFGKSFNLVFRIADEKTVLTGGFTNRCRDGRYVLFLDYDFDNKEDGIFWVGEEIKLLQELFPLGNGYIFETKGGFHVVFLEKFFLKEIVDMMSITTCDNSYKIIPLFHGRRQWVLRSLDKKNELIKYLGAKEKDCLKQRSMAHMNYLRKIYKVPKDVLMRGGLFDNEEDMTLAYYKISERNN